MDIVAYRTQEKNGIVAIESDREDLLKTKDPIELLYYLLEPYPGYIRVVWSVLDFIAPILKLLPKEVSHKLKSGERALWEGFRLWLGATRHGYMFGVSYKEHTRVKGNIYQQKVYDVDIYELKQYFLGEQCPGDVYGIVNKGYYIAEQLERMGLNPRKLSSAASIYSECILDKMPIPTIWNMPEESYPMMEMCANYVREWHGDYKSGNWDKNLNYKYDISAAYPSALAEIPNLTYAHFIPLDECKDYYWAILKGDLNITSPISPVVDDSGRNMIGEYKDAVIASSDWDCLKKWGIGAFIPKSGWALVLDKDVKLFSYAMKRLFDYRGGNLVRDNLAKAMAVSVWGKFLEMHEDNFGNYFNGIYASMVTASVRTKVCEFIYEYKLQNDVLEVTVDGFRSGKYINLPKIRRFGEWRFVE